MSTSSFSLQELAAEVGQKPRTIRFYIARGILDGPEQAGRNASYSTRHLKRLREIIELKRKGLTLNEIALELNPGETTDYSLPNAATMGSIMLSDDVQVLVRGDVPPWRMNRIMRALNECARQLKQPETNNQPDQL